MKTIKVVAAIIIDNGKVFATQRGYGEFKDGWEFPGGKIEEGETAREAIVREIREELDTEIQVEELLDTVEYDYPKFHLSMDCFICTVKSGDLVLKEHEAAKWLTKETLGSVEWLPADEGLIEKIRREAGTVKQAYQINNPLTYSWKENEGGTLAPEYSLVSSDKDNAVIEVVKKAEDSV